MVEDARAAEEAAEEAMTTGDDEGHSGLESNAAVMDPAPGDLTGRHALCAIDRRAILLK